MKERTRKSAAKPRKLHGFRAKPYSNKKRLHKRKPGGGGTKSRTVRGKLRRRIRRLAKKS